MKVRLKQGMTSEEGLRWPPLVYSADWHDGELVIPHVYLPGKWLIVQPDDLELID